MALDRRQADFSLPSSARHLTLRKARIQYLANQEKLLSKRALRVAELSGAAQEQENPRTEIPPKLDPGFEQLYSYYKPVLDNGQYHIRVNQRVDPPTDARDYQTKSLLLTSDIQQFEIVGPRFSFPSEDIHTVYPPQGHGDELRVLPHVVFNDPHIPWERKASQDKTDHRNLVPWLALLVFTQDELRLDQTQIAMLPTGATQSTTLSVNLTLNDIYAMEDNKQVIFPVQRDNEDDPITDGMKAAKSDFIFVPSNLFESFVARYNADGTRDKTQIKAEVSRYKYLAHIRNINTDGMALAAADQPEQGLYSVVVAHRVGPWGITRPIPVVVHLVSIEGVEDNINVPVSSQASLVALSSLYSWTYQCLPPGSLDFFDAMTNLAKTVEFLRPASTFYSDLMNNAKSSAAQKRLGKRMKEGYSLTRYRVQTGEETVAFTRGPFVPTKITNVLQYQSTFSTDLQILDSSLGIMDISYASAWQLGKTMAVADQAFTAAVSRIRTAIHDRALQAVKGDVLSSINRTVSQVASSLADHVKTLAVLPEKHGTLDPKRKWSRPSVAERDSLSFFSPVIRDDGKFLDAATKVTHDLAASTDSTDDHYVFYNEHNKPASTDWAHMLSWVLDRMSFFGVPAHYLITDPSHLPPESLRFFTIDGNWTEAFLDGALSIANHLEQDDDSIRTAIKTTLTEYLDKTDPQVGFAPQIPRSGFLLRSTIVKQFPDLVLSAPWPDDGPQFHGRAEIVRQELIDEQVLLVLFDRVPGDGQLATLTISQPPHQQRFAAANHVGPDGKDPTKEVFEMTYGQVYTIDTQPTGKARREKLDVPTTVWTKGQPSSGFDWVSRTLIFPNFAQTVLDNVKEGMKKFPKDPQGNDAFDDDVPSAALMGIQLNDKMCQISFEFPKVAAPPVHALAERLSSSSSPSSATLNMIKRSNRFKTADTVNRLLAQSQAAHSAAAATAEATEQISALPPPPLRPHALVSSHIPIQGLPTSTSPLPPSSTSIPPQYTISCLPLGTLQSRPKNNNKNDPSGGGIPTKTGYPIDLVFSVRYTGDAAKVDGQGLRMTELRLVIPLGGTSVRGNLLAPENASLLTRRMIQNLRWNPLLTPEGGSGSGSGTEDDLMLVRLLPRSTSGAESVLKSRDLSFVLGQVSVNPYAVGFQMTVRAFEVYTGGGKRFSVENTSCRFNLRPGK